MNEYDVVALSVAHVDFALWGGLVPGPLERLEELAERGVVGFKAFMCPSGIDDFPAADNLSLLAGMARAAVLGLPVAVHAENAEITRLVAASPAERFRLAGKGRLEVGADADLVLVDLEHAATLSADELLTRHRLDPRTGAPRSRRSHRCARLDGLPRRRYRLGADREACGRRDAVGTRVVDALPRWEDDRGAR